MQEEKEVNNATEDAKNNAFYDISEEVIDFVFEPATSLGGLNIRENPQLTPSQRRIDPILAKTVITELPRLTKLAPGEWTVRKLLKAAIHGETGLEYPPELDHYTEEQWDQLLDLAEMYFFKTIYDLDVDYDATWINSWTGWLDPDIDKLKGLMKEMVLDEEFKHV